MVGLFFYCCVVWFYKAYLIFGVHVPGGVGLLCIGQKSNLKCRFSSRYPGPPVPGGTDAS